jgi:hypothetical protein
MEVATILCIIAMVWFVGGLSTLYFIADSELAKGKTTYKPQKMLAAFILFPLVWLWWLISGIVMLWQDIS